MCIVLGLFVVRRLTVTAGRKHLHPGFMHYQAPYEDMTSGVTVKQDKELQETRALHDTTKQGLIRTNIPTVTVLTSDKHSH